MQFQRRGTYFSVSKEGYKVSASFVKGECKFTAWTPRKEIIDVFDNSEDAYNACEDHHRNMNDKAV